MNVVMWVTLLTDGELDIPPHVWIAPHCLEALPISTSCTLKTLFLPSLSRHLTRFEGLFPSPGDTATLGTTKEELDIFGSRYAKLGAGFVRDTASSPSTYWST